VRILATDTDHIVDFSQIDALLNAAGRDGVLDILQAFWRSTDELAAQLARQLEEGDLNEAARTAHAIKGSAANVGASSLAFSARAIEACCRDGDAVAALAAIEIMRGAYANTRATMSARVEAA